LEKPETSYSKGLGLEQGTACHRDPQQGSTRVTLQILTSSFFPWLRRLMAFWANVPPFPCLMQGFFCCLSCTIYHDKIQWYSNVCEAFWNSTCDTNPTSNWVSSLPFLNYMVEGSYSA